MWDKTPASEVYFIDEEELIEVLDTRYELELRKDWHCDCGNCMDCLGLSCRDFM